LNPANSHRDFTESRVEPLVDISEEGNGSNPIAAEKKKKKPRFAVDGDLSEGEEGGQRMQLSEGSKRTKAEVFLFEYGVVSYPETLRPSPYAKPLFARFRL
jgi:hypothetical protein